MERIGGDRMRKDIIITAFLTFCLTATLFMIVPTRSASTQNGGLLYDAWKDINDDGKLDTLDIVQISSQYGAQGTPINKTQMLLDLQNRVDILEQKQTCEKSIVFYNPNRTTNNVTAWKDAAVFVWIPHNTTHNAILKGYLFFRYQTAPAGDNTQLTINGYPVFSLGLNPGGGQSPVWAFASFPIAANLNSYTVTFMISACNPGQPMYVEDIHVVLAVVDGLPPT